MGADFIRAAAPSFKKAWDKGLIKLGTPDLFTKEPICESRVAVAELNDGATLTPGELLTVQIIGNRLIAMRGLSEVAFFSNPAAELFDAVQSGCGSASGRVETIHEDARVAEISIC
jgi:hypothetical protein